MRDEFLKQFRKEPRSEFAEALHKRLAQQADTDLPPLPRSTDSSDSREDSEVQEEQEDKNVNASLHFAALPRRQTYRREGRLVSLVAAVAAIVIGLGAFNALYNANVSAGLFGRTVETPTSLFERYINEAWNAGKTDLLTGLLAADHVCYEPGQAKSVGVAHMAAMIKNYRAAFPNWQFAIKDLVATDDAVWARLVGTGTQTGPFTWAEGVTVNATNSAVTVEMMVIARFVNGKIAEQRLQYDALGLLGQLKAVSSPDTYLIEQRNMAIVRQYVDEVDNQRKLDKLDDVYVKGGPIWHAGNQTRGRLTVDFYKSWFQNTWRAFPDLKVTITHMAAAGNVVITQLSARGTFESRFQDPQTGNWIEPTHKERTWSSIFIWRFEDGKVAEEWLYSDMEPSKD